MERLRRCTLTSCFLLMEKNKIAGARLGSWLREQMVGGSPRSPTRQIRTFLRHLWQLSQDP